MPIKFTVVDLVQWKHPTMLRICGSGLRHLTENQHAVSHKELAFPDHHFWESSMKTLISLLIKFKSCKGKPLGQLSLKQWFPTGGSRPQSGSRRSFVGSRTAASIVCWSLESLKLRISIFCYISKTEKQTDLCEVHIISIIIPVCFLLYSLNQPDCRIESCAERVNLRGLRVPTFVGQVREPVLLCMRAGAGSELLCAGNWMWSQSTWT